jgi:hypothetical protein
MMDAELMLALLIGNALGVLNEGVIMGAIRSFDEALYSDPSDHREVAKISSGLLMLILALASEDDRLTNQDIIEEMLFGNLVILMLNEAEDVSLKVLTKLTLEACNS